MTSSTAAPPKPLDIEIRFASTDIEICAIHRFLLIVAKPMMRCEPDIVHSLNEVTRVAAEEAAIMAVVGDNLVGTLGIIKVGWWYGTPGRDVFMTERWDFVLPQYHHAGVTEKMWETAQAIADEAGLELFNMGKPRERKGKLFFLPRVYVPSSGTITNHENVPDVQDVKAAD